MHKEGIRVPTGWSEATEHAATPHPSALELHHDAGGDHRLSAAQIGGPEAHRAATRGAGGRRAIHADELAGGAIVSAGRTYAASPRPIRHIRVAITSLRPPGDVLFGHPMESSGGVPHVGLIPRVRGEVWRTGDGIGSIDWWQEGQIPA